VKVRFGKFEKIAGVFVIVAIVGSIAATILVAIKQGWLAKKEDLRAQFTTGDGLHVGTMVQMAGLRAGSVKKVVLETNNEIIVTFEVHEDFFKRIKKDSVAQVIRPFIIGEKVIDISVGSLESQAISAGETLKSQGTTDIMDLISGREMGQYLDTMKSLAENLRMLAENMFSKERSKSLIAIVDSLPTLIKNVNQMSVKVVDLSSTLTEKKHLNVILKNTSHLTEELNTLLPQMIEGAPHFGKELMATLEQVNRLTREFQILIPALKEIAPDLPKTSRRTVEAIDELVITLKAVQRNFMLRGKVQEVREEEEKSNDRRPAAGGTK